jgi:hypothetical protein
LWTSGHFEFERWTAAIFAPFDRESKMHLSVIIFSFLAPVASASTVYLIRHGEKPSDGGSGLNAQGVQRAQCLRNVFGASSGYNIEYIIVKQPKASK